MPDWLSNILIALTGGAAGWGASLLQRRSSREATAVEAERVEVAADEVQVSASAAALAAQNQLIDQLQAELERFREATDRRLERLERENMGYRAFIGVQRDHMAEHGIPLPPWPKDLPR